MNKQTHLNAMGALHKQLGQSYLDQAKALSTAMDLEHTLSNKARQLTMLDNWFVWLKTQPDYDDIMARKKAYNKEQK